MKLLENLYLVGSGKIGLTHPFDCNIYLIDGISELVLIDSGAGEDVNALLSNIEREGFTARKISKILLTHHHADHSGGCKELKCKTSASVFLHENGVDFVERGNEKEMGLVIAKRSGFYSTEYKFNPFKVDYRLKDSEVISVGKWKVKAIHVPGHSKDSTCFYMEHPLYRALFSGDAVLFDGKIGILNRDGSSLEDYRIYFHKIVSLHFDALLPGHSLFVLKGGKEHIKKAAEALEKLPPPPNFI